ncbi:hypothetical protein ES711_01330 [Gelidibacter salicanalis]|uniref:DUF898 domain-containing protein n=1 Tax=Gelidibacter salicanalis TaxID=291193 RepID=A0A5C7AP63_9FLAO|nr:hypothetical protein [Gelidibacter salicanalis]TXE10576.1 hypothetical protein ES711_01330 [Gelidibacter salicanalis]
MDELELLKKHWQKDGAQYPHVSANAIYKMILKRSSSIVKWVLIISLLEFGLWTGLALFFKGSKSTQNFDKLDSDFLLIPLSVLGYVILAYFFYLFYRNYRRISVTDNAKILMENILRTRRTVKNYVLFNLLFMVASFAAVLYIEFDQDQALIRRAQVAAANGEVFMFYGKIILMVAGVIAVFAGVLLFFYWLIYGLLLRKLNRNYKELKKLEMLS